jgi:hypothetical protein
MSTLDTFDPVECSFHFKIHYDCFFSNHALGCYVCLLLFSLGNLYTVFNFLWSPVCFCLIHSVWCVNVVCLCTLQTKNSVHDQCAAVF